MWKPDDPQTLAFRDMLARILSGRKLWEESLHIYQETLDVRRKSLPPDAPAIAAAEKNVAIAAAYFERSLKAHSTDATGAAGQPAGGTD